MHSSPSTHIVVIPAYNPGPVIVRTVTEVLQLGWRVIVVDDGCTDGSPHLLAPLTAHHPTAQLTLITHPKNQGKGDAVLSGVRIAAEHGATHAVLFDADGQHPAAAISLFVEVSTTHPQNLICGIPQFGGEAPWERKLCRRLANLGMAILTWGRGPADVLFGMRAVPCRALLHTMAQTAQGRRYDFEAESAILLARRGHRISNVPVPVKYLTSAEGGISHYHYLRDNLRLITLFFRRLPRALWPPQSLPPAP